MVVPGSLRALPGPGRKWHLRGLHHGPGDAGALLPNLRRAASGCRVLPCLSTSASALDAVWVPFAYAWPLSQLVLGYKSGGRTQLGRPLARLLSDHLAADATPGVDCVIPVPLHEQRLAQRGFNQAEQLARVLCRSRGLRLDARAVRRIVATPSQQGLSRRARKANLRGAFAVGRDLSGLRVLLIDDVMTTGTTLNALAREVRKAGAAWVGAVALARA
jgi:ComF family protein